MKVTLITGASSGIGEAFARKLAAKKHNLVLVARNEAKLAKLCDELMLEHEIMAHYVAIDLIDYQADIRLFKETENHGMEVECLINNAGFGSMGDFAMMDVERELEMIGLNIMALVALTHRYLQRMRAHKSGTIINVSSTASFQPIPYMATYAATKAFVTSFSEAIAEENREHGINVLNLCPGTTDTNFFAAAEIHSPVQIKGMQTADEVVEAALSALEKHQTTKVSGTVNWLVSKFGTFTPDWMVTRLIASQLREKVLGKKELPAETANSVSEKIDGDQPESVSQTPETPTGKEPSGSVKRKEAESAPVESQKPDKRSTVNQKDASTSDEDAKQTTTEKSDYLDTAIAAPEAESPVETNSEEKNDDGKPMTRAVG
ncbi:MAG: SDR family oxidoreductase [Pyrinomonadaceae bacterium]